MLFIFLLLPSAVPPLSSTSFAGHSAAHAMAVVGAVYWLAATFWSAYNVSLDTCLFYIADTDLSVFHQQLVVLGWACTGTSRNLVFSLFFNLIEACQQREQPAEGVTNKSLLEIDWWILHKLFLGRRIAEKLPLHSVLSFHFSPPLVSLCVFTCNLVFYLLSLHCEASDLAYECTCYNVGIIVLDHWTPSVAWRLDHNHCTGKCRKDRNI